MFIAICTIVMELTDMAYSTSATATPLDDLLSFSTISVNAILAGVLGQPVNSGKSRNLERVEGGRVQCSPVVIYRKCIKILFYFV